MVEHIRILIADDHTIVREGLAALIETEPGMEVIGTVADGIEVVAKARLLDPDVILLDLVMPRQDGVAAITQIRRDNPDARILVLTSFSDDEKVFPAIKAGASGYLLKDSSPQELLLAIRHTHSGAMALHPTIAGRLIRGANLPEELPADEEPLSRREVEVLRLVARGLTNPEIAGKLVVSERTVSTHMTNILKKLQLANRTQAALYAHQKGLVVDEEEND